MAAFAAIHFEDPAVGVLDTLSGYHQVIIACIDAIKLDLAEIVGKLFRNWVVACTVHQLNPGMSRNCTVVGIDHKHSQIANARAPKLSPGAERQ